MKRNISYTENLTPPNIFELIRGRNVIKIQKQRDPQNLKENNTSNMSQTNEEPAKKQKEMPGQCMCIYIFKKKIIYIHIHTYLDMTGDTVTNNVHYL